MHIKNNDNKNFISALVLQFVTMFSGFFLPRIILIIFGSEINGLVASITQYLSFISLLEGGMGAVVLSNLYAPITNNDLRTIGKILSECERFFKNLSVIFLIYTLVVAAILGVAMLPSYNFWFTSSLVAVVSIITIMQYMFSITNKLFLQANQQIYIVNYISSLTIVANLIVTLIMVKVYPQIHFVKLIAAIAFVVQPIAYYYYVDKKIRGCIDTKTDIKVLKNKWDGFSQNLAHFVNLNFPVVVISLLMTMKDVSVYTIYMFPLIALRSIITSLSNSYQSSLGICYAEADINKLRNLFIFFTKKNIAITAGLFATCLLLINQFIELYTMGIDDANYSQPLFALLITIGSIFYTVREPYRVLILAVGKFKETNFSAVLETIINVFISIIGVYYYGITGIAIGAIFSICYRFYSFIYFLKRNIIYLNNEDYIYDLIKLCLFIYINTWIYIYAEINICSIFGFIKYGFIITIVECVVSYLLFFKL